MQIRSMASETTGEAPRPPRRTKNKNQAAHS
jgi:hypothetical protein